MKRSFLLAFFLVTFTSVATYAQTCMGMTLKAGMGCEMITYNAKDKMTGKMTYNVSDVRRDGNNTIVKVDFESADEKGKSTQKSTLTYTCSGNELIADLSGFMQNGQNQAFKDGEVRLKTNRLVYPALSAGQTLPDGKLEADMYNNGSLMVEMTIDMTNRSVGSKESLTVPAGTFDVFKISSDMTVKSKVMGMSIPANLKVVTYRAANTLFDIRSETYNKNGKLYAYTVLSKVF
ncbi:TapB family protein [Arsenicibacter rosenii]|uniref:DUF3108 domain-containing protein n=1 Tax=Arsenicibacter rosenii TaxID=1750698 RepID=A0A1S2VNJ9_9BACT|nr:hypothetical protein [Arsenicibacter rosenii]OIN60324.1 hypothetical protein BLX24_05715 [Arsenicibacter rosenii]